MLKSFQTETVLSVVINRLLVPSGWQDTLDLIKHLVPNNLPFAGITLTSLLQEAIVSQHPSLADLPECTEETHQVWLADQRTRFPRTLMINGPITVDSFKQTVPDVTSKKPLTGNCTKEFKVIPSQYEENLYYLRSGDGKNSSQDVAHVIVRAAGGHPVGKEPSNFVEYLLTPYIPTWVK